MTQPTTHADLAEKVDDLARKVDHLTAQTANLVEAWNTATGMLKFIKWGAGLVAAITAAWVAIRNLIH